jgi:hypothetical protein
MMFFSASNKSSKAGEVISGFSVARQKDFFLRLLCLFAAILQGFLPELRRHSAA